MFSLLQSFQAVSYGHDSIVFLIISQLYCCFSFTIVAYATKMKMFFELLFFSIISHYVKNGAARSVCIALECFAALFPRTRPQRCINLSLQFYPVLSRIISREEEIIHERLLEALPFILPSMTPFLSSKQVQVCHVKVNENSSTSKMSNFPCLPELDGIAFPKPFQLFRILS